ncbi:hypothetical protein J7M23_11165 [Candidatus Sumerlaeota bacterium]|nr:hypothetical protein [Candidatus Sumerlaeota bacterium]
MAKKIKDIKETEIALGRMAKQLKARECVLVANPSYIYQPYDIYLLAPRIKRPLTRLLAVVKDMDGTTTTTEPLCLHSLEYMLRRITDRMSTAEWKGLDRERDYPHIIGNSTTKHVEYLLHTYHKEIKRTAFLKAYIHSALWTLTMGKDRVRQYEVRKNLEALGMRTLLNEPPVRTLIKKGQFNERKITDLIDTLAKKYARRFSIHDFADKVRAAVDIYYQRYHYILSRIDKGEGKHLAKTLGLPDGRHPVEPMPGVAPFLAALKGWLGADLQLFYEEFVEYLIHHPRTNYTRRHFVNSREKLRNLGIYLEKNPVKVAVVTSSIFYEANIVLSEVFSLMREQIKQWNISARKKRFLLEKFSSYTTLYDAVITASDSSEIRLKPHRDLYSLTLYQLGITPDEFRYCIGFEDSESGTIAIRAAGIGLCVAVPFADTEGHDLSAASFIVRGGLPETLLRYNLFLR